APPPRVLSRKRDDTLLFPFLQRAKALFKLLQTVRRPRQEIATGATQIRRVELLCTLHRKGEEGARSGCFGLSEPHRRLAGRRRHPARFDDEPPLGRIAGPPSTKRLLGSGRNCGLGGGAEGREGRV